MSLTFEEIDFQHSPLGDISLRRRSEPRLKGKIIYEVKLGNEFLMSSLFTEAEIQLARLGLDNLSGQSLNVVVGGLGLGYTAAAVLEDDRVNALTVIEVMDAVIGWHQNHFVPLGHTLCEDSRCTLRLADFFELASIPQCGFDSHNPDQLADAILLDIDHSPSHLLNQTNSRFYYPEGFKVLSSKLNPGGVFGLWSNDPPDEDFIRTLDSVFSSSQAHVISFDNPYTGNESTNTVYIAKR